MRNPRNPQIVVLGFGASCFPSTAAPLPRRKTEVPNSPRYCCKESVFDCRPGRKDYIFVVGQIPSDAVRISRLLVSAKSDATVCLIYVYSQVLTFALQQFRRALYGATLCNDDRLVHNQRQRNKTKFSSFTNTEFVLDTDPLSQHKVLWKHLCKHY